MKVVLDTNAYCDFAAGREETVELIATRSTSIFLPATVIGELEYGFINGTRCEENRKHLQRIMELLRIRIIAIDRSVATKYGHIYLSLVKKGQKIPINDVWIAACCMEIGGTLLTRDHHFDTIEQIDKMVL